ncbi:MAG TPA: hypothetical protein DEO38_06110 [Bacteroidales bacterium]|nr:hypothetical protein [Bacteroidales bacterium]
MKRFFTTLVVFAFYALLPAEDVIYTASRIQIICNVTDVTDTEIIYRRTDTPNVNRRIALNNVWKIIYNNGTEELFTTPDQQQATPTTQQAAPTTQQAAPTTQQTSQTAITQQTATQQNTAQNTQSFQTFNSQSADKAENAYGITPFQPLRYVSRKNIYRGDKKIGSFALSDLLKNIPDAQEEEYKYSVLTGLGAGFTFGSLVFIAPGIVCSSYDVNIGASVFYILGGTSLLSGIICWASSGTHLRNAIDIYNREKGGVTHLEFAPSSTGLGLQMKF